jgi:transcription elongation factor GreA
MMAALGMKEIRWRARGEIVPFPAWEGPARTRTGGGNSPAGILELATGISRARKDRSKRVMTDPLSKIKKKLQDEIDALEHELNLELPKELMKARAHGDLSENAEYKYAKERQGFVSARLGQLKKRMGDVGMLNLSNIPHDRAGYGSRVWLMDLTKNNEVEYKLVTSEEADAANGLISTTSPIGKALLGRLVGDEVNVQTPAGVKTFEVLRVRTIHEES